MIVHIPSSAPYRAATHAPKPVCILTSPWPMPPIRKTGKSMPKATSEPTIAPQNPPLFGKASRNAASIGPGPTVRAGADGGQRGEGSHSDPAGRGTGEFHGPPVGYTTHAGSAAGRQGVLHGGEGGVGVLAQSRDRADADHDDEGQHDRVFDRGRAV